MTQRIARVILPVLVVLTATACQTITSAPKGSPRVELEIAVELDPTYTSRLQDVDTELSRSIANLVLQQADLGLRFYPVLTENYEPNDPRPQYHMVVKVRDLGVALAHRTVKKQDADPEIETFVKQLGCSVSAVLRKRRTRGPELTVGSALGKGAAAVSPDTVEEGVPLYAVKRETKTSSDKPAPAVSRADLLRATENGLTSALKQLVPPVDREFSMHGSLSEGGTYPPGSRTGQNHAAPK